MSWNAHSNDLDDYHDPAVAEMKAEMVDLISKAGFKYVIGHGIPVAEALRTVWMNVEGAQEVGGAFGLHNKDAVTTGKR